MKTDIKLHLINANCLIEGYRRQSENAMECCFGILLLHFHTILMRVVLLEVYLSRNIPVTIRKEMKDKRYLLLKNKCSGVLNVLVER